MRAAVPRECSSWLKVDVDKPRRREVLVDTAAGLCHSDLNFIEDTHPAARTPVVLGHESAGLVEAPGESESRVVVF